MKSFLHLDGKGTGRGVFTTWRKDGRPLLADATAWIVHERHRTGGQAVAAQSFAQLAWKASLREPRLVAAYATLFAAPGDEAALRRAADACAEAFLSRDGSTFDGWTELGVEQAQLLGRRERRRAGSAVKLDDDGNPVPVRRHHPETPRRTRPRRFALRSPVRQAPRGYACRQTLTAEASSSTTTSGTMTASETTPSSRPPATDPATDPAAIATTKRACSRSTENAVERA